MTFRRRSALGLALVLTTGCTAPSANYSMEAPRLSSPSLEEHRRENEIEPMQGKEVSLHNILGFADQHSPLLAVSRAELELGLAAIKGAKPRLPSDPRLSIAMGPRIASEGTSIDLNLGLSQEVEISGARSLRIEAAKRVQDRGKVELATARWFVHQKVHALFHQALIARAQTDTATNRLLFAESLVEIAQKRLNAGDIAPLGLRVAEGELFQAKQAKVAADGNYTSAQLALAEAAGWPADKLPLPAGTIDVPRKTPSVVKLVTLAFQNNPQLNRGVAATRSAEANLQLANREAWPTLQLGLQYNRESDPSGANLSSQADVVLFGVSLPIPLWRKNVRERTMARALVKIEKTRYQSQRQTLSVRVYRAANQVNVAADRIAAFGDEIVPNFEKNLLMLKRAFELGEIEVLDVSVAQRRFLELQQSALNAYYEYYQASATLEQVVGEEVWPDDRHDVGEER